MDAASQAQPEEPQRETSGAERLDAFSSLISELYERSGANDFGIFLPEFRLILGEIVCAQCPDDATESDIRELLAKLRVDELALARGCAAGNDHAWDLFLNRYREGLYTAGVSIARDDGIGRELADSLYADLFGTEAPGGNRSSKLKSYMGIGSLQGWLRTILAHTFIDRYRSEQPLVSLSADSEGDEGEDFDLPASPVAPVIPVDPRLETATDEALQSLDAEDRYLLASWFLHGRTLAELGRTLGVHESTISRRIDKLTGRVRKKILAGLVAKGMTKRQAEEALETDVRDLQINVRSALNKNLQDE